MIYTFNLSPWRTRQQTRKKYYFYTAMLVIVMLVISVVLITSLNITMQSQVLEKQNQQLTAQQSLLITQLKQQQDQQQQTEDLLLRYQQLQTINQARWKPSLLIQTLLQEIPTAVYLETLTVQEDSLNLKGIASDSVALNRMLQQFKMSPKLHTVTVNSISYLGQLGELQKKYPLIRLDTTSHTQFDISLRFISDPIDQKRSGETGDRDGDPLGASLGISYVQ